jgi:thioredoxin reductase (NADPH)
MRRMDLDLVVVGAGLAGLAAATRAAALGLRTIAIERDPLPGGFLLRLSRIGAPPGFPVGLSGPELAERALSQARRFGAEVRTGCRAISLRVEPDWFEVESDDGEVLASETVIIATGLEAPEPSIPGVRELAGSGIHFESPEWPLESYAGCDVFVAGATASAARLALELAGSCRGVVLVSVPDREAVPLPAELVQRVRRPHNVSWRPNLEVAAAFGVESLEALGFRDRRTGILRIRPATALFLLMDGTPASSWLPASVRRGADGFVVTGIEATDRTDRSRPSMPSRPPRPLESSVPGVFAAGHLRQHPNPGILRAVNEGVAAAAQAMGHILERRQQSHPGISGRSSLDPEPPLS